MTSPTVLAAQKRSLLSRVRIDPFFSSQLLSMGDLPEQICQRVGMLKESVLDRTHNEQTTFMMQILANNKFPWGSRVYRLKGLEQVCSESSWYSTFLKPNASRSIQYLPSCPSMGSTPFEQWSLFCVVPVSWSRTSCWPMRLWACGHTCVFRNKKGFAWLPGILKHNILPHVVFKFLTSFDSACERLLANERTLCLPTRYCSLFFTDQSEITSPSSSYLQVIFQSSSPCDFPNLCSQYMRHWSSHPCALGSSSDLEVTETAAV